jgi:hypothetical protein
VLVDGADILLKKFGQQFLREPDRFILEPALDARLPVLGLVEDQRGGIVRRVWHVIIRSKSGGRIKDFPCRVEASRRVVAQRKRNPSSLRYDAARKAARETARVLRCLCIFVANRIFAVVAFAPVARGHSRKWPVFVNRRVAVSVYRLDTEAAELAWRSFLCAESGIQATSPKADL